jgi:hypothetical protein
VKLGEVFAMKVLKVVIAVFILGVFLTSETYASADAIRGRKAARTTEYNAKDKCQVICKAPKPVLEILEDCLAYALDIPLAMLSPITCPIVSAVSKE